MGVIVWCFGGILCKSCIFVYKLICRVFWKAKVRHRLFGRGIGWSCFKIVCRNVGAGCFMDLIDKYGKGVFAFFLSDKAFGI